MIVPSRKLLAVAGALFLCSIPVGFWPSLQTLWFVLVAVAALWTIIDVVLVLRQTAPVVTREMNNSIPLNIWSEVNLIVHSRQSATQSLILKDNLPTLCESNQTPVIIQLDGNQTTKLKYQLKALVRGDIRFNQLSIRLISPYGAWLRQKDLELSQTVHCYPDFTPISKLALQATITHANIGLHLYRQRGEGTDFEQLREYHSGDSLRQIDWKATTRIGKMISKEYRDERNQRILIMLDCGRRMGAKNDVLSHFDHSLNAALLLSYVGLRYGDSVGIMSFGGIDRYLPPKRSVPSINKILHEIYDLQPTLSTSDFEKAAQNLMVYQHKRSLVVLFTNLRDEDEQGLLTAVKLLSSRHLVLVASLREEELDNAGDIAVTDTSSAILKASASEYREQRNSVVKRLTKAGVLCIDVQPKQLAIESVNQYLKIKAAGRL